MTGRAWDPTCARGSKEALWVPATVHSPTWYSSVGIFQVPPLFVDSSQAKVVTDTNWNRN